MHTEWLVSMSPAKPHLVCASYCQSTALLIARPLCKVTIFSGAGTKSYVTSLSDVGDRERLGVHIPLAYACVSQQRFSER